MEFGVRLPVAGPFTTWEGITRMAIEAERLGYDALYAHDNILEEPGERAAFYTGSIEAQERRGDHTAIYGSIPVMAYVAGVTQRIKIIPDALCLGWRNVVILAKEAATLYELSKGRFILNTCLGRGEHGDYVVTNSSWRERGRVVAEKLQFLRMVIDQDGPISFEGKYLDLSNIEMHPRPKGMQLWHSGGSHPVIRRTALYCDGWMCRGGDAKKQIEELYQEAQRVGRGHVQFEVAGGHAICVAPTTQKAWDIVNATFEAKKQEPPRPGDRAIKQPQAQGRDHCVGSPERIAEVIRGDRAKGITSVRLGFIGHTLESILEQMELFAREVMPRVR